MNFIEDMRRRHVFRVLGLYVVGAWLIIQIASTVFPAWNIPDTALRYLIYAAVLGFPVAGFFGWSYDITAQGIVRTASSAAAGDLGLQRTDYLVLATLFVISMVVVYGSIVKVQETAEGIDAAITKPANSIAVLPFENLNSDQDIAYFSDGVSEEILHRLSTFKAFNVLGRASSFAFRDSDYSIPKISDILRVRYVLQGSVRREANQVRVTARLLDESGFQVWSDSFDRELEGIFSIQSDIANDVAQQLNRELVPQTLRVAATTSVADAYSEYLIGREHAHERGAGWIQKATAAYQRAIELDPKFAAPYAGLAITTILSSGTKLEERHLFRQQAQEYIDRALSIDPLLADAHAALGLLLMSNRGGDPVDAETSLRRAIDLDPNFMNAYNWLSNALGDQGKHDEQMAIKERALEIDPLNPIINANMAAHYHSIGDFHRAKALHLRLLELPQPPGTALISIFILHDDFGKLAEAVHWAKQRVHEYLPSGDTWSLADLSRAYLHLGMNADASYWLEFSNKQDPQGLAALMRKSYVLKLEGDPVPLKALLDEYRHIVEMDSSRLPGFAVQVIGAMKIMSGDAASGLAMIESTLDLDGKLAVTAGGNDDALDFLLMAAFGYQQIGNDVRADELLQAGANYIERTIERGVGEYPKFMEVEALNLAMLGRTEEAIAVFDAAVDSGWRNYAFIVHDPRWQSFLDEPAMRSLMSFVKADIERQRLQVEKIDADEDFRAKVDAILAVSSPNSSP